MSLKPKDKLDKTDKNGVIYHIPCAGINNTPCPGTYVGETERTAFARFKEHTATSTNAQGKFKSAMLQHAKDEGHHFRRDDVTILDHEENWIRRGIKEAIFIKTLNPTINLDPGRHTLSTHFDSIINNSIKTPPAPAPHNPEQEEKISTIPRRQGRPKKMPTTTNNPNTQPIQTNQPTNESSTLRRSQRIRSTQ